MGDTADAHAEDAVADAKADAAPIADAGDAKVDAVADASTKTVDEVPQHDAEAGDSAELDGLQEKLLQQEVDALKGALGDLAKDAGSLAQGDVAHDSVPAHEGGDTVASEAAAGSERVPEVIDLKPEMEKIAGFDEAFVAMASVAMVATRHMRKSPQGKKDFL